ncbi:MAG TPA: elongation factor P maturation arginine rhamnosyltransferase EarP [Eoetvoesiella sp.]
MGRPLPAGALGFDIFCKVVDNFGDIGVCWRLAKQLAGFPASGAVRLWVDDLVSFAKIEPAVTPGASQQSVQGVTLIHWTETTPPLTPHNVVIEAFACDPPPQFIARMVQQKSLWINLEYLSAEAWVESCHAHLSLQANGLRKCFFFPGFTPKTGGLLRENSLLEKRDSWLKQADLRWQMLQRLGMPANLVNGLQHGWRQVFLFCYPSAPAQALAQALALQDTPSVIIVPAGVYPSLKDQAAENVYIIEIPFVDQSVFDQLLWCSDLNFVRGEDSLVRALWAAKPLIWQIYEQDAQTHLSKLRAWLARSPFDSGIHKLMEAWNTGDTNAVALQLGQALQPASLCTWQQQARQWSEKLVGQSDLAHSLIEFCAKNRRTG